MSLADQATEPDRHPISGGEMDTVFVYGINAQFWNKVVDNSSASSLGLTETFSMESSGVDGGIGRP
jgi:hypothetical protein